MITNPFVKLRVLVAVWRNSKADRGVRISEFQESGVRISDVRIQHMLIMEKY